MILHSTNKHFMTLNIVNLMFPQSLNTASTVLFQEEVLI